jgi:SSS family solute:Na+ symporter
MEDYVNRRGRLSERAAFLSSKAATLAWGLFSIAFSYQVEAIAPTVLEAINKIGSIANGPLLALFLTALLMPSVGQRRAALGFGAGLLTNMGLWLFVPEVSWLWWNVSGALVSMLVTLVGSPAAFSQPAVKPSPSTRIWLLVMTLTIFCICMGFGVRT